MKLFLISTFVFNLLFSISSHAYFQEVPSLQEAMDWLVSKNSTYQGVQPEELDKINIVSDDNPITDDEFIYLAAFCHLPKIFKLRFINQGLTGEGFKILSHYCKTFNSITVLDIADNNLQDKYMPFLKVFPNLESLNIDDTELNGSGLALLPFFNKKIEKIEARGCRELSDYALLPISKLPRLNILRVHETSLTDVSAAILASSHLMRENLKELNVSGTNISSQGLKLLGKNLSLNEILFRSIELTLGELISVLQTFETLPHVDITGRNIGSQDISRMIETFDFLNATEINVSSNSLIASDFVELALSLPKLETVFWLDFIDIIRMSPYKNDDIDDTTLMLVNEERISKGWAPITVKVGGVVDF